MSAVKEQPDDEAMRSYEPHEQAQITADAVARRSYGKLVAYLASWARDVAAAEDSLSEAFASALADWPVNGCPANPEAWLLTVARRKMIDSIRGRQRHEIAAEELKVMSEGLEAAAAEAEIPDRRLALMFACAHPWIDPSIRAPLILQVVLGFDAARIASAFLVAPATMGQRLVRAKSKIRQAGIPFRVPEREELAARLDTVLDAIYAAFAKDGRCRERCPRRDRRRSAFLATGVGCPREPEALGTAGVDVVCRIPSPRAPQCERRIRAACRSGPGVMGFANDLRGRDAPTCATTFASISRYQLEAALQSAHVYRCRTGNANWEEVVQLYDVLGFSGSPVIAINRALAIAELNGPEVALEELKKVSDDARLSEYQPYWAARAELLARTGTDPEARDAYEMAIGLENATTPSAASCVSGRQR